MLKESVKIIFKYGFDQYEKVSLIKMKITQKISDDTDDIYGIPSANSIAPIMQLIMKKSIYERYQLEKILNFSLIDISQKNIFVEIKLY